MPAVTTVLMAVFNLIFLSDIMRTRLGGSDRTRSEGGAKGGEGGGGGPGRSAVPTLSVRMPIDANDDEDLMLDSGSGFLLDVARSIPRQTGVIHRLKGERTNACH